MLNTLKYTPRRWVCSHRLGSPVSSQAVRTEHQDRGFFMATAGPVLSLEGSCTIKEVRICTRFPFREGSFTKGQDLCPQLIMQVLINLFFYVMFVTYSECKKKPYGVFYLEEKHIKTVKDTGDCLTHSKSLLGCAFVS